MRFGLRTLLIVLALGPPVLAGAWLCRDWLLIGIAGVMTFAAGWLLANATDGQIDRLWNRK